MLFAQMSSRQSAASKKEWTALIFMAAANDLRPYAFADLIDMEQSPQPQLEGSQSDLFRATGPRINVIVQAEIDQNEPGQRYQIHQQPLLDSAKIDFADLEVAHWTSIRSPMLSVGEVPAEVKAPERLHSFLKWGIENFPAEKLIVFIWGHGQGWSSGFAFGGSLEDQLDIPSLKKVLIEVTEEIGRPLDLVVADACLMQMLEVASEISFSSRFIVGSSQTQNFFGLPYGKIFTEINRGDVTQKQKLLPRREWDEALRLSSLIPRWYQESFSSEGLSSRLALNGGESLSMSAINSAELQHQLVPEWRRMSLLLADFARSSFDRKMNLMQVLQESPEIALGMKDVGVFLWLLKELLHNESLLGGTDALSIHLMGAIERAQTALMRSVLESVVGLRLQEAKWQMVYRGVALWLPENEGAWASSKDSYSKSEFYQATQWGLFFEEVFN